MVKIVKIDTRCCLSFASHLHNLFRICKSLKKYMNCICTAYLSFFEILFGSLICQKWLALFLAVITNYIMVLVNPNWTCKAIKISSIDGTLYTYDREPSGHTKGVQGGLKHIRTVNAIWREALLKAFFLTSNAIKEKLF